MKKARFKAPVIEGHKAVRAVIVPFDPETVWGAAPVKLAGRRHGWLVKGTANEVRFTGYIGERWGRFFITLEEGLLSKAGASVSDEVAWVVEPTATEEAYRQAHAQSAVTTQPSKARGDAREFKAPKPTSAPPPRTRKAPKGSRATTRR